MTDPRDDPRKMRLVVIVLALGLIVFNHFLNNYPALLSAGVAAVGSYMFGLAKGKAVSAMQRRVVGECPTCKAPNGWETMLRR